MFTLTQILRAHATHPRTRHRSALTGDRQTTYGELYRLGVHRASELKVHGVGPGHTVAVLAGNRPELVELLVGASLLGARTLLLSKFMVEEELSEILSQASPTLCYAEDAYLPLLSLAWKRHGAKRVQALQPVVNPQSLEEALTMEDLARPEADCWLATSSGSSGLPRIHRITHENLVGNLYVNALEWNWPKAGTHVALAPLSHGIGFSHLLGQLVTGGPSVLVDPFEPARALATIIHEELCWTALVPTMLHDLVITAQTPVPSLRLIICAGAPLFNVLVTTAKHVFPNAEILEYYGATEFGWATAIRSEERVRHPGAVGLPVAGVELQVRGRDNTPLHAGDVGMVFKRGRPYSAGLIGEAGRSESHGVGAWQSAGDLGTLDQDGYLHLLDRSDDMIISGGLNVYPSEVERVILEHPSVRECVVVGMPDERWGERVCAVIAHDAQDRERLLHELESRCAEHLAPFKRPKDYVVWASLPRSGPGKTPRRSVREGLGQKRTAGG